MKAYKIRIFLFIILQAMLWQKTNSTFMDFHCKGLTERETERLENKFQGLKQIGKGSYAEVRGTREYVIKRVTALNYLLEEFNSEIRSMLVFKDQLDVVKFYEDEEGRHYRDFQCFYPKNQGRYIGYLIIPKYFATLHSYITVKSTSLIHRASWKYDMMIKLTIGIKKLHENGFIHCDLKPENIFLIDQFHPIIGDLGETITMYETKDHKSGTNEYLAPEIANATNRFTYTNKVDIFALGILFVDIITASMSVDNFVPQQDKFKLENIENYYTLNDSNRHIYEQFEPLILKMTSDIPSFRPNTDQILEELFKNLKHYLDEDQNTTKANMKDYDEYVKVIKSVYQTKSPNEYHAENKNRYYVAMQKLVKNEVEYFKTGQFNPRDMIFGLKHFIPSEALNIKNEAVQFVKKEDLAPTGNYIKILQPKEFIPELHSHMFSEETLKSLKLNGTQKSTLQSNQSTQSSLFSSNKITDENKSQQSKSQILQPSDQSSSLQDQNKTFTPKLATMIINHKKVDHTAAVNSFKQKFLQNKLQKEKEMIEKKKKEEEQQQQENEKNTLIKNQMNIIESLEHTLEQQLKEQQIKMNQEPEKQKDYVNQKTSLFSQSKIIINLMKQEKDFLLRLKSQTPAQVKILIEEVHQRIEKAQNQADEIQNNFYEIEKQIMNDQHKKNGTAQVEDNEDKYNIFNNDPFNFEGNNVKNSNKLRNSIHYHIQKEFGLPQKRNSVPDKLNEKLLPQNKEEVIKLLKEGYQNLQNKKSNKTQQTKQSLTSDNSLDKNSLDTPQNIEQSKDSIKDQKQKDELELLRLDRNAVSEQDNNPELKHQQILGLLQEHFENLSKQNPSKPVSKKQMLKFLNQKQSKTFVEKSRKQKHDIYRHHPTQSQSVHQRKQRKNRGNKRFRILI